MVQMDEAVNKQLESDELNPKRHPGIVKLKNVEIPDWVKNGMIKVIAGIFYVYFVENHSNFALL